MHRWLRVISEECDLLVCQTKSKYKRIGRDYPIPGQCIFDRRGVYMVRRHDKNNYRTRIHRMKGGCIGIGMASVRSSGKWFVPFV